MGGLGCAGGSKGVFREVQFEAPSLPDPQLRPLIDGVERIGVLSATNIEPFRELDIEKVMGRLADATSRSLGTLPDRTIIGQDEIRWHFRDTVFDSATVFSAEQQAALKREMGIDALVFIELTSLKAQMTPMSPGAYGGLTSNPGLDMSVNLKLSLINLDSGQVWSRRGERRNWQPVQLQVIGGGDQTERQLLTALAGPMRTFLQKLAPLPSQQLREFELTGN